MPWKIYWYYIGSGGWMWFILMLLGFFASGAARIGSSVWLAKWTADTVTKTQYVHLSSISFVYMFRPTSYWIYSYIGWAAGEIVGLIIAMLIGLAIWGTNVSRVLHDDLIERISKAVIAFFDATPIGRILTRLSEDMSLIDFLLQVIFVQTINNVMLVVAAFVAIGVGSWMVFVATLVVVIAYYCLQLYFRKGNIEIQRLVRRLF